MIIKLTMRLLIGVLAVPVAIAAKEWEKAPFMDKPPFGLESTHTFGFTLNGKAYALGGNKRVTEFDDCGDTSGCTKYEAFSDDFLQYDPSTGWTKLDPFPGGPRGYSIGAIMDPGTDDEQVFFGMGQTYDPNPDGIPFQSGVEGLVYPRWRYLEDGNTSSPYLLKANSTRYPRLNDLWTFNGEEWIELSKMPGIGRTHPAMVAVSGKVYVGAGWGELCTPQDTLVPDGTVYDGPCPEVAGLDDSHGRSRNLGDFWLYSVDTDSWEPIADLPKRAHHPFQFAAGEHAYVVDGHDGGFIRDSTYRHNLFFDGSDSWTEVSPIPNGVGRVAGTQFTYKNEGYVLCGETAPSGDNIMSGHSNVDLPGYDNTGKKEHHRAMDECEFWKYNAEMDEWTQLPSPPGPGRWGPASFVLDGYVYLFNGVTRYGQGNTTDGFNATWPAQGYRFKLDADDNSAAPTSLLKNSIALFAVASTTLLVSFVL